MTTLDQDSFSDVMGYFYLSLLESLLFSLSVITLLGLVYTERQSHHCDVDTDTGLIESNGATTEWGCNPFETTPLLNAWWTNSVCYFTLSELEQL